MYKRQDHYIGPDPLLGQGLGSLRSISAEEAGIFNAVFPGVLCGVLHRLPYDLYADYLFDLVGQA